MMTWSKTSLAIVLSTLAFGAGVMSGYPQAKVLPGEDPVPVTSGGAGVIEGKMVSGDNYSDVQQHAQELGVSAYFGKPYHLETLLHSVAVVIQNISKR